MIYDGSLNEWKADPTLPLEIGPGRQARALLPPSTKAALNNCKRLFDAYDKEGDPNTWDTSVRTGNQKRS
jgi:hypothetical protein